MPRYLDKVQAHASRVLAPSLDPAASPEEVLKLYKSFLKKEEHRIRLQHRAGLSGTEVCSQRAGLLDVVLHNLFARPLRESIRGGAKVALIATGGYGRGLLNPGSDVDLHFLHMERAGREMSPRSREVVENVLYMLWDVGFKVGHAVRSLKETFQQALKDHQTMCALLESRFITGERAIFDEFEDNFRRQCVTNREKEFLDLRARDVEERHSRSSNTVHLQEPNVKTGCGGLRDYHNMIWVSCVKLGTRNPDDLRKRRIFSESAVHDIRRAHDFLLRVRNEMHYAEKRATDLLTLRLQGTVATNLGYTGRRIVQRCEAFMRDYYHHARNLYQHNLSLMERFALEREEPRSGIFSFLAVRNSGRRETFDGFQSRDGFIFPASENTFTEDSGRLMRLFQHTQLRRLKLSPQIRTLVKENYGLINRTFRYRKTNRETWEAILSRKGEVGPALRQMHRVAFLGRYLPEFMPLTDLVQHEFFHRYTADEHTLKCLEKLDELSDTRNPSLAFHQRLFHDFEDPFILYLALLLHDTGRAEGVKKHAYASTELTDQVCRRLQVSVDRRQLLLFLVDNHLLFWHTATTRNLDDPDVIASFAAVVRRREWLDALFLHTFADSRATNESGWTDWKESLVRQLYSATAAFLEGKDAFTSALHIPMDELRAAVTSSLGDCDPAELDAHFLGMPDRYFNFRAPADITLHLRTCRQFFRQLRKDDPASALKPVLRWEARPERGCSEVILVTWDRHLLLAKAAGALAAAGINILSADLFVRKDGTVVDIFRVCTTAFAPVTDEKTIAKVSEMLTRACMGEEIDFADLIRSRSRAEPEPLPGWNDEFPSRVWVANSVQRDATTVDVQAIDRIGLLHAIFSTIGSLGLEITHARINTEKGAAIDSFRVTDASGAQLTSLAEVNRLKQALEKAIGML